MKIDAQENQLNHSIKVEYGDNRTWAFIHWRPVHFISSKWVLYGKCWVSKWILLYKGCKKVGKLNLASKIIFVPRETLLKFQVKGSLLNLKQEKIKLL